MSKRSAFDKALEEYDRVRDRLSMSPIKNLTEAVEELRKARNKLIAYHYHNVERSRGTKVKRA